MTDAQVDRPRIVNSPGPGSIMAVAAHPDDIERWSAGTLAHAIDMGASHTGSSGGVHGARPVILTRAPRTANDGSARPRRNCECSSQRSVVAANGMMAGVM